MRLVCNFFLVIFCYSSGIEVVLRRVGIVQERKKEKGKEVTEVFIRRDYENYGEKVKDVEE